MEKNTYLLMLVGMSVFVPSLHDAIAQIAPACTTVKTNEALATHFGWEVGTGVNQTVLGEHLFLDQDASGNITGNLFSATGGSCLATLTYSVAGTYQGNGNFVLHATNPAPPDGCASEIDFTGTLSAPGCDHADVNFSNSLGNAGNDPFDHGCYVPSGETKPALLKWGDNGNPPTVATFVQTLGPFSSLAPLTPVIDWGGRHIYETSPPNSGSDTCYYKNNFGIVENEAVTGGGVYLESGATYKDDIGASTDLVLFYRGQIPGSINRAPCGYQVTQQMWISCQGTATDPDHNWQTHPDSYGIGTTAVTAVRNGQGYTNFWVSPQVRAASTAIVTGLLLNGNAQ